MKNEVRVFFAGDFFLGNATHPPSFDDALVSLVNSADLATCNYEAPAFMPQGDPCRKAGPALSQDPAAFEILRKAGFSIVNLANNHIIDSGGQGVLRTIEMARGLHVIGAGPDFGSAYKPLFVKKNGIKIAFLSFAEWGFGAIETPIDGPGFAWINHPETDAVIAATKKKADFVLVQVHAGAENVSQPLPVWRARYRTMIESGADAVVGHHPHIIQGWESHRGKPIFYSLGNFFFPGNDTQKNWNTGCCLILTLSGKHKIQTELHYVQQKDGILSSIKSPHEENARMTELNRVLEDPGLYQAAILRQVNHLWDTFYRKEFRTIGIAHLLSGWKKRLLFWFFEKILRRNPGNPDLILYHLLRVESHRYCIETFLQKKTGD